MGKCGALVCLVILAMDAVAGALSIQAQTKTNKVLYMHMFNYFKSSVHRYYSVVTTLLYIREQEACENLST